MTAANNSPQPPQPFELVSLPQHQPQRSMPTGHDTYWGLSGRIALKLHAKTNTIVASGVVAMGDDISKRYKDIPLLKVAVQRDKTHIVPGSSLKGVVRSAYEAITSSCLCKVQKKHQRKIPQGYKECRICRQNSELCPSCRLFGAMGYQGKISFYDSIPTQDSSDANFFPNLFSPQTNKNKYYRQNVLAGRKFYYPTDRAAKSFNGGGIHAQQAQQGTVFETTIDFTNLDKAELGTLMIVLGRDSEHPIALKAGGGKPVGFGSLLPEPQQIDWITDRYLSYDAESNPLQGEALETYVSRAIETAKKELVQGHQLQELSQILGWPTNRQPPESAY
jgi:CRISPR/Cas system CSM-associated protein Csm3 (group 7 of RAMP superfamily)